MTSHTQPHSAYSTDPAVALMFLHNLPGLWWIKSVDGKMLETSPNFAPELGVSSPIGRTATEIFGTRVGRPLDDRANEVLRTGRPIEHVSSTPAGVWRSTEFLIKHGGKQFIGGVAMTVFGALRNSLPSPQDSVEPRQIHPVIQRASV